MNGGPSVVVNKGGFFSALAKGFFGLLIALVVCVTAIGLYSVRTVDRHVANITQGVPAVLEVARGWQEALPPALKDALNDRRAFEYRDQLDVRTSVRDVRSASHDVRGRGGADEVVVAIDVENRGAEVVSLLALHLFIEDDGPRAVDTTVYAATPIAVEDEWRGPLLPGQARRVIKYVCVEGQPEVKVDVVDLRVWVGPALSAAEVPATELPERAAPPDFDRGEDRDGDPSSR